MSGDLMPFIIVEGSNVDTCVTDVFWFDVGSTEMYEKLDSGQVVRLLVRG